jgi:hypothetical protein
MESKYSVKSSQVLAPAEDPAKKTVNLLNILQQMSSSSGPGGKAEEPMNPPPAYLNFNGNESQGKKAAQKEVRMFYQPPTKLKPQSLDQMGRNAEEFSLPESPKVKQVESKRQLRRQPSEFEEVWD